MAPGDFNGDGKTDAAVFNAGTWTYKTSPTATAQTISFGTSGDIPVAGDYDGDGITDAAVYRTSNNSWWILKSGGGSTSTSYGSSGDIAVPGDYDGDGKNDLAVYRPSTGDWHITPSSTGIYYYIHWGIATDTPVAADFDGDGKTDPAVFRPSTGTWYVWRSDLHDGSYFTQTWGNWGDQPVTGDYDGDNKADYAIWRPTTGVWYILKSTGGYSLDTLGVPGDTAVPSAYLKQVGGQITGDALAAARLQPRNATGETNLYSQNFSWGTSLVSLPGRSGLDASIGIGYNSLVWTKVGSSIVFDADHSNASPGFKLGFPTIEPIYYDSGKATWSYMMISPSGGRTEFRQSVVSNIYETADSSYTQLIARSASNPNLSINPNDPVEGLTLTVTTTEGTQMSFAWSQGAYRCTQIKDRNGNYISIAYDGEGRLDTTTDTLGRVIEVNYDSTTGLPTTVTQTWKESNGVGPTINNHVWATFTYATAIVDTDFDPTAIATIVGPPNTTGVTVLDKITYADGSATKFDFNGYVQVKKVSTIAADSTTHVLNSVETSLSTPTAFQPDCPRFEWTKTSAENFNGGNPVTVTNSNPVADTFSVGGLTGSASRIDVAVTGHPNNLYSRTFVGPSGWKEGLTLATEDCIGTPSDDCSTQKRWTWTDWTQDDTSTSVTYPVNPRVVQSRVGDGTNTKKTAIEYHAISANSPVAKFGLVKKVEVGDLSTVFKSVQTEYQLDPSYVSRRIIGLPLQVEAWGKNNEYVSKVTYGYDEGTFSEESNQNIAPAKHDSTYSSTFTVGRGNPTSITRHDVTGTLAPSIKKIRYDIAGSPVAVFDARDRKSTISYADNFNSTVSEATFAYPTTITDAGGNSSTIQYRYDLGANVWARSPKPEGSTNVNGKTTSRTYDDSNGRLVKQKIENTGAYTRYDYSVSGTSVNVYTTVADIVGVGTVNASDEVLTESLLDGAGRLRMTRTENPNSFGGYTGKRIEYDLVGRVKRESVPTEINSSWNPAGDDDRGVDTSNNSVWLWNESEYDWKGRVTREINTDGTDRLFSYDGCGCAGGQITTVKGELTDAFDVAGNPQTSKRRTQKSYEDILGRVFKTEIWDVNGGTTGAPYSATVSEFNGRDQATKVTEYSGPESSTSPSQETTFEFDGHGRLKKSHKPEWRDTSNNLTYTSYTYNADDTIATVTDPRGAIATYKYGNIDDGSTEYRSLLTKVIYASPNTTSIPDAGEVSFVYDPAGNRKTMNDPSGTLTYVYDELSRLASETKQFAGTGAPSSAYTLQYTYTLAGGIKSIKDPDTTNGWEVDYATDKTGRTTTITPGSGFGSLTSFATGLAYRAFGGMKSMSYSTTAATNVFVTYDNRLRPATYEVSSTANSTDVQNKTYSYTNDGLIKEAANSVDSAYGQIYQYDFAGRLKKHEFGTGVTSPAPVYKQTLGYDAFDNLTSRATSFDSTDRNFTAGYTNNRKTSGGYGSVGTDTYDSAGNVTANFVSTSPPDSRTWKFDAAGRMTDWVETSTYVASTRWDQGETLTFDGDGRTAKRLKRQRIYASPPSGWYETPEYCIYSSVTGQKLVELDQNGQWKKRNVYVGSTLIAEQTPGFGVVFKTNDPVAGTEMQSELSGEITPNDVGRVEHEPLGAIIPTQQPEINSPPHDFGKGGSPSNPETNCQLNSVPVSCKQMMSTLGAWGALFAGGHLIVDTWRPKYRLSVWGTPPGEYSWRLTRLPWELVRTETIDTLTLIGLDDTKKPINGEFVETLRPFLKRAVERGPCAAFIKKYAKGANFIEAYDKLLSQGGLVQIPYKFGQPVAAFSIGGVEDNNAQVQFNFDPNPWPARSFAAPYIRTRMTVYTLIHELFHLILEGGHDAEMARRVHAGGDSETPLPNPADFDRYGNNAKGENITFLYSQLWDNALQRACLPPDEEFKQWWRNGGE